MGVQLAAITDRRLYPVMSFDRPGWRVEQYSVGLGSKLE